MALDVSELSAKVSPAYRGSSAHTNSVVDYVSQLETGIQFRDDEIANLQSQLESQRNEINELRLQLKLPLLPRGELPGLGLTMEAHGQVERWENNDSMSR